MQEQDQTQEQEQDQTQEQELEQEHVDGEPFKDGFDICQQLMDRYAKSSAPQHRHLLATAVAMRSILEAESLPLTPPAYFAAAISAIDNASSFETLDLTASAALSSFLAITLPLVISEGVSATKASEAVGVLVRLLERQSLAVSSVRAVVKCLGILVGFCDLQDWGSVNLGFTTLLKFSTDRRPKVRRCAQECLEKLLKSFRCSTVIKEASKSVISLLRVYKPLAVKLNNSTTEDRSKNNDLSAKPEHLEVLHVINVLTMTVPFLSKKVLLQILKETYELISPRFSAITRHVFKIIEAVLEFSKVEVIISEMDRIIGCVGSYLSLGDKNPSDTLLSAMTLLKRAMDVLHAGQSSSEIRNLPLVSSYMGGLLTSDSNTASHASDVLKQLILNSVDHKRLLNVNEEAFQNFDQESVDATAIKSTCVIFHNLISVNDGIPNEHILDVISALFLKLGETSVFFMKNIVLKLADLMNLGKGNTPNTDHLQSCIGSAVIAMGPEKILTLVPISVNASDFTSQNIWMVPILKKYVVGASLGYYMEYILPLAKSFRRAFHKVKRSVTGKDLGTCAQDLKRLLPAFCRHPTDMHQNIKTLSEVFITFLKKDSFMYEDIAIALQVLVNQNKIVLSPMKVAGESFSNVVKDSLREFRNVPTYSEKTASRNIKALASYSTALLEALADLFVDSEPMKRSYLKAAIGCLASITDSAVTKDIFLSLLKRLQFIDCEGEFEKAGSGSDLLTNKDQANLRTVQRRVMLELASSIVEGAKEDLIDLIYRFITSTFMEHNEMSHREAYYALSRILEEHDWFCSSRFVELIDLLLGLESPADIASLTSRFASYHLLMVHSLKISSEEENTKAFLILNEIILTLKDAKEEAGRKAAYDLLFKISSTLRTMSSLSSDSHLHKFVSMIMGYLSGASPHIMSGAVSALSVLLYQDVDIFLSTPDLVPSLLFLLQGKAVEVVKAVLGFVKVLVSCLQAKDLQNILSDILNAILPWSSVSRHHFRSKITVVLEILIRKCGSAAVESITPGKFKGFVKTVSEGRHGKGSAKDDDATDTKTSLEDSSIKRTDKRKHRDPNNSPSENGSWDQKKRKRENKRETNSYTRRNKPRTFTGHDNKFKVAKRGRLSNNVNRVTGKDQSERRGKMQNGKFNEGPPRSGFGKRKMNHTSWGKKDEGGAARRATPTWKQNRSRK